MAAIIMVDDNHILYSKIATLYDWINWHCIYLSWTHIDYVEKNLCIPIETQIMTHIGRILILLSQQIPY